MNIRLFQQIEVYFLNVVIDILSNNYSPYAVFTGFFRAFKQRPLFVTAIIVGSVILGMLTGFTVSLLTA